MLWRKQMAAIPDADVTVDQPSNAIMINNNPYTSGMIAIVVASVPKQQFPEGDVGRLEYPE